MYFHASSYIFLEDETMYIGWNHARRNLAKWLTERQIHWYTWWRHQIETFSALLAICAWKSPVIGEFPAQRPVTRSFDVFFHLRNFARCSNYLGCYWLQYLEIGMNSLGLETCIMRHHQVDLILVTFFFKFHGRFSHLELYTCLYNILN